jgi:4-diphosphocytidyl-2-C-methyl-D-erythritol kinase
MLKLTCPAPAKLNLFLHVTGQRADGYHLLQTAFQILDYCDELTFSLREDEQIHLSPDIKNLPAEDNLIVKAARLLQKKSGITKGVDIILDKKIPMGGGLGGGSSNAATTLLALNYLWKLNLTTAELLSLGLQLGADVPVFIHGKSTWAEGVGEKFSDIALPESWFVVLAPPCSVSTAEIFSSRELTRDTSPLTIQAFLDNPRIAKNDLEPVVKLRYPLVASGIEWLNQFSPARLTGSGACIFAIAKNKNHAEKIISAIPEPFSGFIAKGIMESPLIKCRLG